MQDYSHPSCYYIVRDDAPLSAVRSNPWQPLSLAFDNEKEARDALPQYRRLYGPVRIEKRARLMP